MVNILHLLQKYNINCRKLCNRARLSGLEIDFQRYKKYQNTLNRLKLYERRWHYNDVFKKIGKNTKLLWNVMNNLIKRVNNKTEITEILVEGRVCTDEQDICSAFNRHFARAGEKLQASVGDLDRTDPCDTVKRVNNAMKFGKVTESEVCQIVSQLKPKTSTGLDGISNWFLKKIVNILKGSLCVVFNKSLSSSEYPELMKVAKVIPLHKTGETNVLDNYRPISLLPVISKVLEKMVYKYTVSHLNENNVLYSRQYELRRKHSTVDAVMNFTAEVLTSFSDNRMVLSVFIDLRKAFDSVSHSTLFRKLEQIGIRDLELNWYKSYISGRKQRVSIGRYLSDPETLNTGVAQGSLLGVLLFQLIINDMFCCLKFCTSILYADDTTLIVSGSSLKFIRSKMQSDLNSLQSWLQLNKLKLNIKKTKCMLLHKDGLTPNIDLSVVEQTVKQVTSFKISWNQY